jgi:hypothetical protein
MYTSHLNKRSGPSDAALDPEPVCTKNLNYFRKLPDAVYISLLNEFERFPELLYAYAVS